MKLLLDQGLPRSAAALLRARGMDAVHVGELEMAAAKDPAIIAHAREAGYTIVTLDADFHTLLAVSEASGPSVVRLRMQRLRAVEAAEVISEVVKLTGEEIERGAFVTATATSVRVRRLPIIRAQ